MRPTVANGTVVEAANFQFI